jgi:uncharacterized spore protein YtfJ
MDVEQLLGRAGDTLTVKRVFGEAVEKDGITVIPVAAVRGGGGGGGGSSTEGEGGSGGGFGITARPVGAFVIKDGEVNWRPAYDATRVALVGELVAVVALLTLRSVAKSRARRRRRARK